MQEQERYAVFLCSCLDFLRSISLTCCWILMQLTISVLLASMPHVAYHPLPKPPLRLTLYYIQALTSGPTLLSLKPVLENFSRNNSVAWLSLWRRFCIIIRLTSQHAWSCPHIIKLMSDFFNSKEPNKSIDTDEAVAHSVAIKAAIFSGDTSEKTWDLLPLNVVHLSLGYIHIISAALSFYLTQIL